MHVGGRCPGELQRGNREIAHAESQAHALFWLGAALKGGWCERLLCRRVSDGFGRFFSEGFGKFFRGFRGGSESFGGREWTVWRSPFRSVAPMVVHGCPDGCPGDCSPNSLCISFGADPKRGRRKSTQQPKTKKINTITKNQDKTPVMKKSRDGVGVAAPATRTSSSRG